MQGLGDRSPSPREILRTRLYNGEIRLDQAMRSNPWRLRRHQTVLNAGEHHEFLYRLVAGTLARVRRLPDGRRQIIRFFSPGDLIGVPAMLFQYAADDVEALSNASLLRLRSSAALDLAVNNPDVALRLMWQLATDERRLRNHNIALAKGTAKQRIATMLVEIGALGSFAGEDNQLRVVSLRQQDIADHIGLTNVHVNRTLRRLRDEGAIEVRIGSIRIRDWPALLAIAEPMLDTADRNAAELEAPVHPFRQIAAELHGNGQDLAPATADFAERIES